MPGPSANNHAVAPILHFRFFILHFSFLSSRSLTFAAELNDSFKYTLWLTLERSNRSLVR